MYKVEKSEFKTKDDFYKNLLLQAEGLIHDEKDYIANLSNISALIFLLMNNINWAGFYLIKDNQLVLGPFQGKPACIRIEIGNGVCGTAVKEKRTQRVGNVECFKGHIACDAETKSELVIPIIKNDKILGVLDIDSPIYNRFDTKDEQYLKKLVKLIREYCEW